VGTDASASPPQAESRSPAAKRRKNAAELRFEAIQEGHEFQRLRKNSGSSRSGRARVPEAAESGFGKGTSSTRAAKS
jgi:hypothetical protein